MKGKIQRFITRARVLLKAAPTYLVVAAVVVSTVTNEIADALPGDASTAIVKIGGKIVAAIGAAVAIVRKVAPVLDSQKGLLGPKVETVTVGPPPPDK